LLRFWRCVKLGERSRGSARIGKGGAHCVQESPSALLEYSIFTSSVPFTTPAMPSSWPKLPKREARTHLLCHQPPPLSLFIPIPLSISSNGKTERTRTYIPFPGLSTTPTIIWPAFQCTLNQISRSIRHPGQRNSSPFCVNGAVPGIKVVTAWMMWEVVGPRERAPPQLSLLMR
jgi:hypothetical protein